jgi:predicted nucleic acid-binding Zn finger protein
MPTGGCRQPKSLRSPTVRGRHSATATEAFRPPPPKAGDVTAVDEWKAALAEAGELTGDVVDRIVAVHGDRGRRAIEAVAEERVKEYHDFTVVVGHTEEYVVEDGECTCRDAQYNLDPEDPTDRCWHAIAVDIARRVDALDHHDMWYSEVREFL